MAKTAIADVIIPSLFEKYVIERTATLSAFGASGIVESDPFFDALAAGGGNTVDMPFWQDVNPARQILADNAPLTVNKIGASKDIARIQMDANAWSVNDLAKILSGDDPMGALVELVGDYWIRVDQSLILSSLKGLFGSATMAGNKLSIASETIAGQSATTRLNGATFVDATVKLGDRGDRLTAVAMHSATEAALRKLDLIDFIPDSEGKAQIKTFQGRRVIVDDGMPVRNGTTDGQVYTTYLFGPGAFAKGAAPLAGEPLLGGHGTEGVEWARAALDSDTNFINRRRFILHPRGVKFNSAAVAGTSPTNAELEDAANWTRVFENKNVRIVAVEHNN
ncbi:MAG TPA: coat protein [Verrucomicrobiae bacterium]|nr:coat protein [Verrucomicrobiae bacterium]